MIQRGGKCSLNSKWMFWPTEMLRSSARNRSDENLRTLRYWSTYKWNRMDPYQWCTVWSILRPFLANRNPNSTDSYWQRAVWASSLDGYAAHCVHTPIVWCHYSTVQWRARIAISHNFRGELAVDECNWFFQSSCCTCRKIYFLCQTRTVWPIVTHLIIARRFICVDYAIEYAIFEAQRFIRMSNNDKYEQNIFEIGHGTRNAANGCSDYFRIYFDCSLWTTPNCECFVTFRNVIESMLVRNYDNTIHSAIARSLDLSSSSISAKRPVEREIRHGTKSRYQCFHRFEEYLPQRISMVSAFNKKIRLIHFMPWTR